MRRRQVLQALATTPLLTGAAAPTPEFVPVAIQLAERWRRGVQASWHADSPRKHWINEITSWVMTQLKSRGVACVEPRTYPKIVSQSPNGFLYTSGSVFDLDVVENFDATGDAPYHAAILRPRGESALLVSREDLESRVTHFTPAGQKHADSYSIDVDIAFPGVFQVITNLDKIPDENFVRDWVWCEAIRRNEWLAQQP